MAVYVYDGTFEGLLTAVAMSLERNEETQDILRILPSQCALFHQVVNVETNHGSTAELFDAVAPALSAHARRDAYHAFLGGTPGIEMLVCRYLQFGRKEGRSLDRLLSHDLVLPVRKLAQKVRSEAHRMKGFVRFRQVSEGFFYASLEPDHDILPLIAPHFADRFSDQNWIIHDLHREKGLIYNSVLNNWVITGLGLRVNPEFSENELYFTDLWKRYFDRISVEQRKNPRLQGQMLPKKYRKHLLELNGCPEEQSSDKRHIWHSAHLFPQQMFSETLRKWKP
jgi:probable DNA metabolism protein